MSSADAQQSVAEEPPAEGCVQCPFLQTHLVPGSARILHTCWAPRLRMLPSRYTKVLITVGVSLVTA